MKHLQIALLAIIMLAAAPGCKTLDWVKDKLPDWSGSNGSENGNGGDPDTPLITGDYPWIGKSVINGGGSSSHVRTGDALMAYTETHRITSASIDRSLIRIASTRPPWPITFGENRATIALIFRIGNQWYVQGFAGWCPDPRFSGGNPTFASNEIWHHGQGWDGEEIWLCLTSGTRNGLSGPSQRSNFLRVR